MGRRKDGVTPVEVLFHLFRLAPWFVGPILAGLVYAFLAWFVPWWMPPLHPDMDLQKTPPAQILLAPLSLMLTIAAPWLAGAILVIWGFAQIFALIHFWVTEQPTINWSYFSWRSPNTPPSPPTLVPSEKPVAKPVRKDDRRPKPVNHASPTLPEPRQKTSPRRDDKPRPKETISTLIPQTEEVSPKRVQAPTPVVPIVEVKPPAPKPASRKLIDISELKWHEFELLLVDVLRQFGFTAQRTGKNGPDGGVDIRCTDSKGQTILVQCKHWRSKEVGVKVVREFFGVLTHEKGDIGLIAISGLFTTDAKAFAADKPIHLINGEKLLEVMAKLPQYCDGGKLNYRISHLESHIGPDPCPACGERMVLRTTKRRHEPFWGCESYPKCNGIRKHPNELKKR